MSFRPFYRRRFLNRSRHHAGAYVIAECSVATYRKGDHHIEATMTIADCYHVATLDFGGHRPAGISNALSKARALRRVVDDFCDALEAAAVEIEERRATDSPD